MRNRCSHALSNEIENKVKSLKLVENYDLFGRFQQTTEMLFINCINCVFFLKNFQFDVLLTFYRASNIDVLTVLILVV